MGEKVVALKDTKLFIPFENKAVAKELGAWWSVDKKQWEIKAGEDIKSIPEKYFREPIKIAKNEITFKEFATTKGLIIDDLQADGLLNRVPIVDAKVGAKDGTYVYFDDDKGRVGWLQNHKTGEIATDGNLAERSEFIKDEVVKGTLERKATQDKAHCEVAKKALSDYMSKHDNGNRVFKYVDIKKAFARAKKTSNILTDFRFHDLRRIFATHMMRNGATFKVISEIFGHSTLPMTES